MDKLDMDALELPELDSNEYNYEPAEGEENAYFEDLPEIKKPEPLVADDFDMSDVGMPVLSEMDGSEVAKPEPKPVSEPAAPKAEPVLGDMNAPVSAPKTEAPKAEAPKSSMQARLEQPFDMPGAYTPVNQSAATQTQSNSSYTYQRQSREDMLDAMYAQKRENYARGQKKAKILGIVIIALAALSPIASLLLSTASASTFLDVALFAIITYYTVNFMKGSGKHRISLGKLAVIDAVYAIINGVQGINVLNDLSDILGVSINTAPVVILMLVRTAGFAAMAYFLLMDNDITDFAND